MRVKRRASESFLRLTSGLLRSLAEAFVFCPRDSVCWYSSTMPSLDEMIATATRHVVEGRALCRSNGSGLPQLPPGAEDLLKSFNGRSRFLRLIWIGCSHNATANRNIRNRLHRARCEVLPV